MSRQTKVDLLIEKIRGGSEEEIEKALEKLRAVSEGGLTSEEGECLLKAAIGPHQPRENSWADTGTEFIRIAERSLHSNYAPVISEIYQHLAENSRPAALALLATMKSREAAFAYINILKNFGWPEDLYPSVTLPLAQEPRHADIFFPALIDGSIPGLVGYSLCLAFLENGILEGLLPDLYFKHLLNEYADRRNRVASLQSPNGNSWRWEDNYASIRFEVALLLKIMGWLNVPEIGESLTDALSLPDPKLKFCASMSLLRKGQPIDPLHFQFIAESREMRGSLFASLKEIGRPELFPREYASQPALAESVMVTWLSFPTELGCEPDDLELMQTIQVKKWRRMHGMEYYVFRFRTYQPHWAAADGWMAGVSGPFSPNESPTPDSGCNTFSQLTPWDQMSPRQHFEALMDVLKQK